MALIKINLSTSASTAASALGVGTEDSPQFTAIELGHASDTTLARSSAGIVTIEGAEIRTGTVPIAKGGTGAPTLDNLITMGTHTTGNYVQTITGGDGITSTGATSGENIAHSLSVDTKANGGLVFESNKLAIKLDHNNITGKLAAGDGGTGHDSYTIGQILVANSTSSLTKLTPGTSGYFLKSEGAGSPLVWSNVAAVGSSTPAALSAGSFLVGGPFNGASAATFNVQGDNANIANKLVARDASGDIRVEEVIVGTGTTGSLTSTAWSGSAARLTNARTIGGVSFNGSADINLPGVNQAGNQNTSGNAATATKLAASVSIGGVLFDGSASITPSSIASSTSALTDVSMLKNIVIKIRIFFIFP